MVGQRDVCLFFFSLENRQERTSKLQHMVFLDFIEEHPNFDPRQHLAKKHISSWREVVAKLNDVGPSRNVDTWVYILHSWRNQIKSKAKKIAYDPHCGLFLSSTEQRAFEVFEKGAPLTNGFASNSSNSNLEPEGKSNCKQADLPAQARQQFAFRTPSINARIIFQVLQIC